MRPPTHQLHTPLRSNYTPFLLYISAERSAIVALVTSDGGTVSIEKTAVSYPAMPRVMAECRTLVCKKGLRFRVPEDLLAFEVNYSTTTWKSSVNLKYAEEDLTLIKVTVRDRCCP